MVEKSQIQKFCSLYVNEMHLIVMIIPYIESELEKGRKVVTVLEDSLEDEIQTFIKKVNLGKLKKNRIKKINWNKNLLSTEQLGEINNKTVLVKGSYEYIKKINEKLANNKNIKIINCFYFEEFEQNSRIILEAHDAIINTTGIKNIPDIFKMSSKLKGILTKQAQ